MSLESVSAVLLAIGFLVPGFIMSSVVAMTFRRRSRNAYDLTLQFLTFSCFNHALWSWLIVLAVQGDWVNKSPTWSALLIFMMLFVSPLVLGLCLSWLSRFEVVRRWVSAFGFKVERFIPTAWDWRFEHIPPSWVVVRLRDGSTVHGFFGEQSFAGDDHEERDLFIECVYTPSDDKPWQPVLDSGGILIKSSEIVTIEFRNIPEMPNGR